MKSKEIRRLCLSVFCALLVLLLASQPAAAQKKKKTIEGYKANAIVMTGGGGSSALDINIYRWSSEVEREEILDAIKTATSEKTPKRSVAKTLRGQEKAGYMFLAGRQGYPLRYAREVKVEGGRQIILATDRVVTFQEAYQDSMVGDFDVTIIILRVDESGKGEGVISIGTELTWDEAAGKLNMTNTTSQPVKLAGVRKVK